MFDHLKSKFETIKNNSDNPNIEHQKEALSGLHSELSRFRAECKHRVTAIELYGTGSMSKTLSTILSGVFNVVDVQKITYRQHLGGLSFEYHENEFLPDTIRGDYKFIERNKNSI